MHGKESWRNLYRQLTCVFHSQIFYVNGIIPTCEDRTGTSPEKLDSIGNRTRKFATDAS